jgi:hypothetical protein
VEQASFCGTGIFLWNRHLFVEQASFCGTGKMPVLKNIARCEFQLTL